MHTETQHTHTVTHTHPHTRKKKQAHAQEGSKQLLACAHTAGLLMQLKCAQTMQIAICVNH